VGDVNRRENQFHLNPKNVAFDERHAGKNKKPSSPLPLDQSVNCAVFLDQFFCTAEVEDQHVKKDQQDVFGKPCFELVVGERVVFFHSVRIWCGFYFFSHTIYI